MSKVFLIALDLTPFLGAAVGYGAYRYMRWKWRRRTAAKKSS